MSTFLEIILPLVSFALVALLAYWGCKKVASLYRTTEPETIDAVLYVAIGMFTAVQSEFGSEAAYQYVNPYVLYWLKVVSTVTLMGATAFKAFRSGRNNVPKPPSAT